jgi:uncharacterized membrane protein HdeD (DUF308 family)
MTANLSEREFVNLESVAPTIKRASGWLIVWSIVVFVCGILAIVLPLTFSFAIAFVIGSVVLLGGIAHLVFAFHTRRLGGFFLHILLCAIYELAAVCLLVNPLLSVLSLSLILAVFLLLGGILELALFVRLRRYRHSLWVLVDGIGTMILGVLIVRQWPPASPETLSGLIGASLILSAVSRIIFALAFRTLSLATV